MNKKSGFTLIEVVIVIIIVGVMATIVGPKMTQNQEVSRIGEAVQVLSAYRGAQERWRLDHSTYTADCSDLDVTVTPRNFNAPTCANDGSVSIQRSNGAYTIAVNVANAFSCTGCTAGMTRYLP
jgi:prepilin-type N-terminal cleavage/methylation domain-containing protein